MKAKIKEMEKRIVKISNTRLGKLYKKDMEAE